MRMRRLSALRGHLRPAASAPAQSADCVGEAAHTSASRDAAPPTREQLLHAGYCVVPDVLSPHLLERLRAVTDAALDAQTEEQQQRHLSQVAVGESQ